MVTLDHAMTHMASVQRCSTCNLVFCSIRQVEFRDDLKVLFEKAAVGGKPVTFLFNDNQVRRTALAKFRLLVVYTSFREYCCVPNQAKMGLILLS